MKKKTSTPRFTDNQRQQLQRLGLLPQQIETLEASLPLSRILLKNPAPMAEVREELRDLHKAIKKVQKATAKISEGTTPARKEAYWRLQWAATELEREKITIVDLVGLEFTKPLDWLEIGHKFTENALDNLPKQQRRKQADSRPIERIDKALLEGFTKAHKPPFPPYTLKVSSSDGSTFRQIVGICYEAMGQEHCDPERAIKNYLRITKHRSGTPDREKI